MAKRTCVLSWCDLPHCACGYCAAHYQRWLRGKDLTAPIKSVSRQKPTEAAFWLQVERSVDCWTWTGTCDKDGYGLFTITADGHRYQRAHRYSYWLATQAHPGKLWVLHRCDNPPCVRPDHLFLGTAADNTADMMAKERNRHATGDRRPGLKLSDGDVAEIRARWTAGGITQTALAREFGVSFQHISEICNYRERRAVG